ncbi:AAA family ATPase [Bradyrhizobium amphicarpaeae]|uniref:AAA family ATPase n=1 Tax=Bradyrhizobium amphicarpaeae TaxID=1404768 RepID=A0A2U8PT25_9BRAD|nr:AAA family ATPase [Bradyrhizobium amphicarpaeae]AWM00791.1 AAA family ATPase [Bradyrhizobium amphicarpaeae]
MNQDEANGERQPSWRVFFGPKSTLADDSSFNTIHITESPDNWNDFGHQTGIDYEFRVLGTDHPVKSSGSIGFISSETGRTDRSLLSELVSLEREPQTPERPRPIFFTMLRDMEAYRLLVQALGAENARGALIAANDLVSLQEFSPTSDILERAVRTEVFSLSFMRSSDAFFAFKNAGSVLRGLSNEELGRLSSTFAIRFQLPGRESEHDLKFSFDHDADLPKRIAIVIGKNGVGKSQALGRIARAAIDGSSLLSDGTRGGRPLINRLLAFAPTNEAESVFPSDKRKRARIWYRRHSMNRSRRSRRGDYVSDLVVQVARSTQQIASNSRWDIFVEALGALASPRQIHLVSTLSADSYVSLADLTRGSEKQSLEKFAAINVRQEPVRVIDGQGYPLSSGEISFLKFAAQASLQIENGSLLLLDEPETHLHPNFISRFVALLNTLLESTGSAAIIATHSAYFVREVFREQVTILSIDAEGAVRSQRPNLRTFGADVGAISYFVFGEDEPSKLALEVESRLLARGLSWPEVYDRYKEELSLELLNALRAAIEGKSSK